MLCGEHLRIVGPIYRGEVESSDREGDLVRILAMAASCDHCGDLRFEERFRHACKSVNRESIPTYLKEMAKVKATFPGYPQENLPAKQYLSAEALLLRDGQRFASSTLDSKEFRIVEKVWRALDELVEKEWARIQAKYDRSLRETRIGPNYGPPLVLTDPFVTAQRASVLSRGALEYVEGFARLEKAFLHPERPILPRAWNLIGGKVVDFCYEPLRLDATIPKERIGERLLERRVVGVFGRNTEYYGRVLSLGRVRSRRDRDIKPLLFRRDPPGSWRGLDG